MSLAVNLCINCSFLHLFCLITVMQRKSVVFKQVSTQHCADVPFKVNGTSAQLWFATRKKGYTWFWDMGRSCFRLTVRLISATLTPSEIRICYWLQTRRRIQWTWTIAVEQCWSSHATCFVLLHCTADGGQFEGGLPPLRSLIFSDTIVYALHVTHQIQVRRLLAQNFNK